MEFLEGETLADRLRKGPLTAEQLLTCGTEICEGLEKAHKTGVIHRDLKPGNIMLTKTGAKRMDSDWPRPLRSPDGRYLSFDIFDINQGRRSHWILPLFGDRKPFPFAPLVGGNQYDGNFSPDGHWLAYFSDETGQPEVYVVPFPGPGGKYQISHGGGWIVRWDKKGDLFFLTTGNQRMKAELNLSAQSLQVKSLRPLFQINLADTPAPLFDVSADGQRVVAVTPAAEEVGCEYTEYTSRQNAKASF